HNLFISKYFPYTTLFRSPELINALPASTKSIIIIGTIEKSSIIQQLIKQKKINVDKIKGKWDAYQVEAVNNPFKGIENALVIIRSEEHTSELQSRVDIVC